MGKAWRYTDFVEQSCCLVFKSRQTLLQPQRLKPARLLWPWDSPGKNTELGCPSLLQGIFLTQGLTARPLHLLHWQADSLQLSHLGSPEQS